MSLREGLQDCIDSVLSVRESLDVQIHDVYLVERFWSEGEIGTGHYQEVTKKVSPAPRIADLTHSFRLLEGGQYQQGDLMIRQISKSQFPTQELLSSVTGNRALERFFLIDGKRYQIISVSERLLWWNIQVRKLAKGK
jgi:hypothetical protein